MTKHSLVLTPQQRDRLEFNKAIESLWRGQCSTGESATISDDLVDLFISCVPDPGAFLSEQLSDSGCGQLAFRNLFSSKDEAQLGKEIHTVLREAVRACATDALDQFGDLGSVDWSMYQ